MILGIDQGTTGSTAILLSEKGRLTARYTATVPQHFPQAGWVEHDPKEILSSVREAVLGVLHEANISPQQILCVGLTNQRETVSLFDGNKALHRFIVWQDRRTSADCKKLSSQRNKIFRRTGTPIDPYFSSTKISWLMKKLKVSKKNKSIRFRTIDSFLLKTFTGEDVIEASNAHRTQLLNLMSAKWDSNLLSAFKIPMHMCPEVIPSEGMNLKTKGLSFLPDGIPIQAVLGDQQAALFGQAAWKAGEGKMTFGTGAFILLNTGEKPVFSKNSLVSTIALQWKNGKRSYALEGSAFICGAWVQWLREQLGMIESSEQIEDLAKTVHESYGVLVIPALSGMGAPFWKPLLRGAILGLTRGSNKSHLARASLEALSFQNRALIDAMKKDNPRLRTHWKVDGGAVKNNLLMQIQSNVLGSKIFRPKNLEATATGAALLAAYAHQILSLKDIEEIWKVDRIFEPSKKQKTHYDSLYKNWIKQLQALG